MSKGYTVAPWRPVVGTGQKLTVPLTGNVTSAAVGSQTRAILLSVITGNCLVRITQAGTNAADSTGNFDALIKTTDIPLILACSPGDKVNAYGIAAGTLYMNELTQ